MGAHPNGYGPAVAADRQETAALLALLRDRPKAWAEIADLVEERGSALAVLRSVTETGQIDLLGPSAEQQVDELLDRQTQALEGWQARGFGLVTLLSREFPAQLRTVHQRPPVLFYRGTLDPDDAHSVAVVGTRQPTDQGLHSAREMAAGLAARGVTVVSGLATGVDTAAHEAALAVGGRTVAVIGTGLTHSYPPANRDLQERLASEHLVLSQFWPDAGPTTHSFPLRNAVMSGYAAATVVIEAAGNSGARLQARLAQQHGRPVFLMRPLLRHEWACAYAARPNTTVVDTAQDVLAGLSTVLDAGDELVWA
ncbi:MAG: hypothetical protein NVSMB55_13020 [Mycobacteriales bacterium]